MMDGLGQAEDLTNQAAEFIINYGPNQLRSQDSWGRCGAHHWPLGYWQGRKNE